MIGYMGAEGQLIEALAYNFHVTHLQNLVLTNFEPDEPDLIKILRTYGDVTFRWIGKPTLTRKHSTAIGEPEEFYKCYDSGHLLEEVVAEKGLQEALSEMISVHCIGSSPEAGVAANLREIETSGPFSELYGLKLL